MISKADSSISAAEHPFLRAPHRTLMALSFPVLLSLIAEPLTGLTDTAFVARLGATSLAALGVGTMALSSMFWVFNFLGIGGQTEVAQALGRRDPERARQITSLALLLSGLFGLLLIGLVGVGAGPVVRLLGAGGQVQTEAVVYIWYRLLGAPAVLTMFAAFGVLRGLQDMRTPLWIAVSVNALNIGLDALLIFGYGPLPAWGIAGAALASTISQWLGAAWAWLAIGRKLGYTTQISLADARDLLRLGRDLFIRTGLLLLFLLLATRVATQAGPESGAAHTAIRQVYVFSALVLEAFATTAQSLVGFFIGAGQVAVARRVVGISTAWSVVTGLFLGLAMWLGQETIVALLVPATAVAVFGPAWLISLLSQPLNALAFITDGVHWGTGDYRFLRNAMLAATLCGGSALWVIDPAWPKALLWVWVATGVWITVRAIFGLLRIWPGIGQSPFRPKRWASAPVAGG